MKEKPIYIKVVHDGFRQCKSTTELHAVAEKYRDEIVALKTSGGEYDIGIYHSIRNAFKYYMGPLSKKMMESSHG